MKVIIAGGGTGGHLFPGVAIAEEFIRRNGSSAILFIGTERGLEKRVLEKMGFDLRTLAVEGIAGRGLIRSFGALLKIPRSMLQSRRIIREFRPDVVVGVGGYASGPAVLAARLMGIRTAVAEQNALPGMTNRILGKIVDRVFVSFAETTQWFSAKKVLVTGNPIRTAFASEQGRKERKEGHFTILVFGGSQGAQAINRAVLDALPQLQEIWENVTIIHQTGPGEYEKVSDAYHASGVAAEVLPFIMDMAQAFLRADILICRAGATSIAEITASGKAAILIPFPFATGDHQTKNAELLVKNGAAQLILERDLDGKRLAEVILQYYHHPEIVRNMEKNAKTLGHPLAAAAIVDACLVLAEKGRLT